MSKFHKVTRFVGLAGLAALVLTLGAVGGGMASAQEEQDGRSRQRDGRGPAAGRLLSTAAEMDLSQDQIAKLEALREVVRANREMGRERRGNGQPVGMDALKSGQLDPDAVHAAIDQRFDESRARAHAAATSRMAFIGSLDADQRAALIEKMEEGRSNRRERARKGRRGADRRGRGPDGGPAWDDSGAE